MKLGWSELALKLLKNHNRVATEPRITVDMELRRIALADLKPTVYVGPRRSDPHISLN
ncbi:MAG: hypothetical protein V3R24_04230 [Gemmatimonadales bacterium]